LNDYLLIVDRYPDEEVAWTAGMRAAQLTQALGDPATAARRMRASY